MDTAQGSAPASPRPRSGRRHVRQVRRGRGQGSDSPSPSSLRPRSAGFLCHKSLFENPTLGVGCPSGRVLSLCNKISLVSAAAAEEGPQGETDGGAWVTLPPPHARIRLAAGVLAPLRAGHEGGWWDTGQWGRCGRDRLGERGATPAVSPCPFPGPSAVCSHPTEVSSEPRAHDDTSTREGSFCPEKQQQKWDARRGDRG